MTSLRFSHLRSQNLPRCRRWHPEGAPPWTFDDWLLALGGEVGEALNVVKKLNRDRDGLAGNTRSRDELIEDLAGELADVVIYLDICVGWDEPEKLLIGHNVAGTFGEYRSRRHAHQAHVERSASQLGNRLLAAVGDQSHAEGAWWARDVFSCTDRLAEHFDIDLGAAVVRKFNATSERFGFPERLVA